MFAYSHIQTLRNSTVRSARVFKSLVVMQRKGWRNNYENAKEIFSIKIRVVLTYKIKRVKKGIVFGLGLTEGSFRVSCGYKNVYFWIVHCQTLSSVLFSTYMCFVKNGSLTK